MLSGRFRHDAKLGSGPISGDLKQMGTGVMDSTLDCISCFLDHALHVARKSTDDPTVHSLVVDRTLELVSRLRYDLTPPEMAREIHQEIRNLTGLDDPYLEETTRSTEFALRILPLIEDEIRISEKPFETLIRFIIAGNIIDFGADRGFLLETAHQRITETLTLPLDENAVHSLEVLLERADSILYLLDNCGEAVFDRLLAERYRDKITLAVRGGAILNDITRDEVEGSGLSGFRLIDTGDRTPGVSMRHSSEAFLREFRSAALIVAKGQGNFETLSNTDRPIAFLLRTKCHVIERLLGSPKGSMNIVLRNVLESHANRNGA
jgi:uncharacterized protein with ATP-grasp and redox domains